MPESPCRSQSAGASLSDLDLFLAAPPGLERIAADEARAAGFRAAQPVPGGVTLKGGWPEVWRAHLELAVPNRVLVRLGSFRALHLAQLDKRARKFAFADTLPQGARVRVEASTRASRIWHAGAAAERVERALVAGIGAVLAPDAALVIKVRIEDDLVTLSLDATGAALHKRGWKIDVAKAPLRETLAAGFLRQAGFDGTGPVVDPMCGSGTLVIEAAAMAAGLQPGRLRGFAFQDLPGFDPDTWAAMRGHPPPPQPEARFFGFDRDDGAIRSSAANAARAGVAGFTAFRRQPVSDLVPPMPEPGLVITNPPWGARIGERKLLFALYGRFGEVLAERFRGWRVALIAPDAGLVKATGLGLEAAGPVVDIGGVKAALWVGAV